MADHRHKGGDIRFSGVDVIAREPEDDHCVFAVDVLSLAPSPNIFASLGFSINQIILLAKSYGLSAINMFL